MNQRQALAEILDQTADRAESGIDRKFTAAWKALHRKYDRLRMQHDQKNAELPADLMDVPADFDLETARKHLKARKCLHCGRPKPAGNAFCKRDFDRLDASTRKSLWTYGDTFIHAYSRALRILRDLKP